MLLWILVAAVLVAKLFPDTPCGRWLHRRLIEAPARQLSAFRPRHLVLLAVTAVAVLALGPIASPELVLTAAGELGAYVEMLAAALALAAALRSRAAWTLVRATVARRLPTRRPWFERRDGRTPPRKRRAGRVPPAGSDSEPMWTTLAAA